MWKEALVAQFGALSRHAPGETEDNYEKPRSGWPMPGSEIWTQDLPNMKKECWSLDRDIRSPQRTDFKAARTKKWSQ
jgi:hypothetical protein